MATYTTSVRITKEKVIALPLPSNFTELEKAMAEVREALTAYGVKYSDDVVTIKATDEDLEFTFEIVDNPTCQVQER